VREIRIPGIKRVLRLPFSRRRLERDVADEIRFHLEARAEELIAQGVPAVEARRRAEAEYGDVVESQRELAAVDRGRLGQERREELFLSFIDDLRYAARGLLRRPALLIVTTFALTIGIAANAVMFGVVDQLLLRPPAYVMEPEQLTRIYYAERFDAKLNTAPQTAYVVLTALREKVPAFSDLTALWQSTFSLGRGADASEVQVQLVSGNFFSMLGVQPTLGRAFAAGEDRIPLGDRVAVVSDGFWRRELGAAREAIGRQLYVDGHNFTVIGVAPRGFGGIDRMPVDMWVPISALAGDHFGEDWYSSPGSIWVQVIGRLKADAPPTLAEAQGTAAFRGLLGEWKQHWRDSTGSVVLGSIIGTRAPTGVDPQGKVALWLMGVSVIVLLIACANVANLLIARTLQRRREIAVRLALGVSRGRLLRLLLTEAILLALFAAGVALLVAHGGSRIVQTTLLPDVVWSDAVVDARVLLFTLAVTVACIVLAGIAPALQGIRTRVSEGLKASARQVAGGRSGLRYTLLVAQAALSIMLLIGAGLFIKSLRNVNARDVGLDAERVLLVSMDLDRAGFDSTENTRIHARARDRLRAMPGVASATTVRSSVPKRMGNAMSVKLPGVGKKPELSGGGPYYSVVDAAFFGTLGATILRGRGFTESEERLPSRTMIVNDTLAKVYWPGADPIGQCVKLGSDTTCTEIVGVVENVLLFSATGDERAMLYLPAGHPAFPGRGYATMVRASGKGAPLIPMIRQEVQRLAPEMPFVEVTTFADLIAPELRPWRLGATMFTLFGLIALVIAAVGLYSVLAYWVSQRTQEIGVRMALGAQRGDVVRLVASQAFRAIAVGLLVGGALAAGASRWMADLLYQTSARDPLVFAAAAVVLGVAAFVASVVPAHRSASIDPSIALRAD
jgi:putative ABC transport system permease protein